MAWWVTATHKRSAWGDIGPYAKESINKVAAKLRSGKISPDTLPIKVIIRNGEVVTLNNRSLLVFRRAGVRPTIIENMTGNKKAEKILNEHLRGNSPSRTIRIRGGEPGTSFLE